MRSTRCRQLTRFYCGDEFAHWAQVGRWGGRRTWGASWIDAVDAYARLVTFLVPEDLESRKFATLRLWVRESWYEYGIRLFDVQAARWQYTLAMHAGCWRHVAA